jgi:hypothetical protein
MNHGLKVIIGFTVMIAIGIGVLYYIDQSSVNNDSGAVNASSGCASWQNC